MRAATFAVCMLLVTVAGPAAGAPEVAARAKLELARGTPLTLKGSGFAAGESVRVTGTTGGRTASTRVTAGARGLFVVIFPTLTFDRCAGLVAFALGARGSRAGLKLPELLCPPSL